MFSVVRSVILDRRECVCVCGSCWFFRASSCCLCPHTLSAWRRTVSTAWSHVTLLHFLPVADAHRATPAAPVPLTGCTATSSHDGALLCPGPRATWEIEGLRVKVKARRLGGGRRNGKNAVMCRLGVSEMIFHIVYTVVVITISVGVLSDQKQYINTIN